MGGKGELRVRTYQVLPPRINFEKDRLRIMLLKPAIEPGEGFSYLIRPLYRIAI
jgi:hypothetical protein